MKLKSRLLITLFGGVLSFAMAACSVGDLKIPESTNSPTSGSGETSQGGIVGGHSIYIDGEYDEENPNVFGGQILELSCLIDDQPTDEVEWKSSSRSLATVDEEGVVQFHNVRSNEEVTITATSTKYEGVTLDLDFSVKPAVVNIEDSYPEEIGYNQDATEYTVPKEKSALIFNQEPSTNFYAEVTFVVSDRDNPLTRIGLMTSTDDGGESLNGVDNAFFYYVHISSTAQDKTISKAIGIASTNASKKGWAPIRTAAATSNVYVKGQPCTLGLLRHGIEYYVFSVKNNVKTNITHYTYGGIGASEPSYVWLGTSFGESGTGDNGRIAYQAKNFNYVTGKEADAIYEEFKVDDGSCTHQTVSNGLCLECGELIAPLSPYTQGANTYNIKYANLCMSTSAAFSITYNVHWDSSVTTGNLFERGWAMDIDSLGWQDGGWSIRPDWWGWGGWNPPSGGEAQPNPNPDEISSDKFAEGGAMKSCDAVLTVKYVKDSPDNDGNHSGHMEVVGEYTSTAAGYEGQRMHIHYVSKDFSIVKNTWKAVYLELGGDRAVITLNALKINYGTPAGNLNDIFRVYPNT